MASRTLPGLGLNGFWNLGENLYKDGMDANLLKLSSTTRIKVIDMLAAVPGSPTQGDMYILTSAPNVNTIAVYDNSAWTYFTPYAGWTAWVTSKGGFHHFDGTAWNVGIAKVLGRATAQATTSGTFKDFDVPLGVNRITVVWAGMSWSTTQLGLVQARVAGSAVATGYVSGVFNYNSGSITRQTTGFILSQGTQASSPFRGSLVLTRVSGDTWEADVRGDSVADGVSTGSGEVTLAGDINGIRFTSVSAGTFDAGSVNVMWEF